MISLRQSTRFRPTDHSPMSIGRPANGRGGVQGQRRGFRWRPARGEHVIAVGPSVGVSFQAGKAVPDALQRSTSRLAGERPVALHDDRCAGWESVMTITTMATRDFSQDVGRAKRAAKAGPVCITDRGKPAHVRLSVEDDRRLAAKGRSPAEALSMPGLADIDVDPPPARIGAPPPDLS